MMFKWQIRRRITKIKKEIILIEGRMRRPHAACIQALLEGKEIPQEEADYHKMYMDQIIGLRNELHALENRLNQNQQPASDPAQDKAEQNLQ